MPPSPLLLHVVAFNMVGDGMSGGDRIHIETTRRLVAWGHEVHVWTSEEGHRVCTRWGLGGVTYHVLPTLAANRMGFLLNIPIRVIRGWGLMKRILASGGAGPTAGRKTLVYSASDFYPDSLPGWWLARRLKAPWVGTCYLFAPNPFSGFDGGLRVPSLSGLLYWLGQKPIVRLLHRRAKKVFVTYDLDIAGFDRDHVHAIYGGVEYRHIEALRLAQPSPAPTARYEGVFVGRIHPQKGLNELVAAWARVVSVRPGARLALVGVGTPDWERHLRAAIRKHRMEGAIDLLGYVDGDRKYSLLLSSRVFLCTNLYDSGGMATIEGMACGLPVVSFDFPATRSLLHRGTLRVPYRDAQAFAEAVLCLLRDPQIHERTRAEALDLAAEWDWEARSRRTLGFLEEAVGEA